MHTLQVIKYKAAESVITEIVIKIPDWLEAPAVFLVLLYRRLRYGYAYRRIPLSQGEFAIVDPVDHERLSQYKWQLYKRPNTSYAMRHKWLKDQKRQTTVAMHREVIDVPEGCVVDHINHNGLDNRRANLRPATPAENSRYSRYSKRGASSKYRGVWYDRKKKKWRAVIGINRRKKQLGYFTDEKQAALAYDMAARKYHKKFAITNFPDEGESKRVDE